MPKKTYALIACILNGIMMIVSGLAIVYILFNFGFYYLPFCLIFLFYIIVQFLFGLFGYLKENSILILFSALLGVFSSIFLLSGYSPLTILSIIACVAMFVAFAQLESVKKVDNKNI